MGFFTRVALHFFLQSSVFGYVTLLLFSTAVPFWGQTTWTLSDLSARTGLQSQKVWRAKSKERWVGTQGWCDRFSALDLSEKRKTGRLRLAPTPNNNTVFGKYLVKMEPSENMGGFSLCIYSTFDRFRRKRAPENVRAPCANILLDPVRTGVPFWGQTTLFPSDLSPKRDCSTKRIEVKELGWQVSENVLLILL